MLVPSHTKVNTKKARASVKVFLFIGGSFRFIGSKTGIAIHGFRVRNSRSTRQRRTLCSVCRGMVSIFPSTLNEPSPCALRRLRVGFVRRMSGRHGHRLVLSEFFCGPFLGPPVLPAWALAGPFLGPPGIARLAPCRPLSRSHRYCRLVPCRPLSRSPLLAPLSAPRISCPVRR